MSTMFVVNANTGEYYKPEPRGSNKDWINWVLVMEPEDQAELVAKILEGKTINLISFVPAYSTTTNNSPMSYHGCVLR